MFNINEYQHYILKLFENRSWYYYDIIQYLNFHYQNHIFNDSSILELLNKGFLNTYYDNNRVQFFTINNVGKELLIQLELFKNQNRITNEVKAPEIFFSYAWGDEKEIGESREKIVNSLYESLKNDGYKIVRDKIDLGYKGLISDFM
jgi:hypothetical protein